MRATRRLPAGYVLGGTIRLAGNQRLKNLLNLLAVPWLLFSAVVVGALGSQLRPSGWRFAPGDVSVALLAALVGGPLLAIAAAFVLHEAAHGLVLWLHTGARPVFGFKGWYFFADAPGWFVGRPAMLVALAAPLVLVPLVGLPLVAWAPTVVSLAALVGLIANLAVAIGDLYLMVVVVRIRGPVIFGDEGGPAGEAGCWFVPASPLDAPGSSSSQDMEAV